jgi:hypothetical protein
VYINNVIIPEENVRINTNEIHLVILVLNIIRVERTEISKIMIAIVVGFIFFNIRIIRTVVVVIFLYLF